MQLRNLFVGSLTLLMTFCLAPLIAQETEVIQDADLADPIDTSDLLVAKGIYPLSLSDADLRERLSHLTGCLELRTTGVVKGYIKTYVQVKTEKTKGMLGKRLTYFPLFEQKLREYGLPTDLKYLSVVESALNAKAVSRVGATGLWQFMPSTGSDYGLRNNSAVEDRSNPVKSTDAAARYLKALYTQYKDWALALAAYNSGPGRVNSAIRRAGSRNFWAIQRFLPQETRNYVPAFIAATYICNYYQVHGLNSYDPDFDEQLTSYIKVYDGLSFRDISEATGIEYSVIKSLNPGFKRDYVPPTAEGHFVIMPERVMPAFVRYLNSLSSRSYVLENSDSYVSPDLGNGRYWQTTVNVLQPEHIELFAQKLGCNGEHLKCWNKLTSNFLQPGQTLTLWRPVFVQKHSALKIEAPAQGKTQGGKLKANPIPNKSNTAPAITAPPVIMPQRNDLPRVIQYQFHTVRRNESLEDIARQYATTVASLRKMNTLDTLKVGMRLKVREQ